ncbi:type 1 glutamine amidotransferase [Haloprofundus salilacus]|uniref:type 1 glutamine amidotransferase n=1 Tax=Haloprofundus salilacus TaxID=2876190 RepID=UPI001CCFBA95|nr:type 1 glutamine amidotransferase [Haloprofundus salilacus]
MILVLANEVDPEAEYFVHELAGYLPDVVVHDYARDGGPRTVAGFDELDGVDDASAVDGVVLSGSTAGVYESDAYPWMDDQRALVRELVDEKIPTLGVCFGHQLVNDALGGTVEHRGLTTKLVSLELADDPLFAGVNGTVPMVHGDVVVDAGAGMDPIASADYYPLVATRHREAPLWTTQFHPEFTEALRDRVRRDFGWSDSPDSERTFDDVTATRVFENFRRLASDSA